MKQLRHDVGDFAIINGLVRKFYPHRIGQVVTIKSTDTQSKNTDYIAETKDGYLLKFRDVELNRLPKDDYILQFEEGQTVVYKPSLEVVKIEKIDYINRHVEIKFIDEAMRVVSVDTIKLFEKESDSVGDKLGYFGNKGLELGKLVDLKQESYGDSVSKTSKLVKIFLEDYKQNDGTYILTEELIDHILLQVRIIDKQNRIFSNPKADKMGESPYKDISGYGLLGERMQNK